MIRGVRQGCPASGYLFTMSFDPVFRWLITYVLPPEAHRPCFQHRTAFAHADDLALANAYLRESLPIVAGAFATIDQVTGVRLNYRECHWIQYGNMSSRQLAAWISAHVPVFQQMQINNYAKYLGVMIGPGGAAHRKAPHSLVLVEFGSKTCLVQHVRPVCPHIRCFYGGTR